MTQTRATFIRREVHAAGAEPKGGGEGVRSAVEALVKVEVTEAKRKLAIM